jgi:hypothetical protein
MKIEIITNRKPFVNGKAADFGEVFDVSNEEARTMVGNGFAIIIEDSKPEIKKSTAKKNVK